ncbi:MAG: hypothetical protein HKP27_06020 [Myxococcales bacterium]|nr:hypothetical protein [Myxococcales bacterium]
MQLPYRRAERREPGYGALRGVEDETPVEAGGDVAADFRRRTDPYLRG